MCALFSHTHYWYEVGILKVSALCDPLAFFAYLFVAMYVSGGLSLFKKSKADSPCLKLTHRVTVVVVVVVFTSKTVPISTQYLLTSVLVQLTRMPSVVTG